MTTYKKCKNCDRDIRPQWWRAKDHPGTVSGYKTGLCVSCHRRLYKHNNGKPPRQIIQVTSMTPFTGAELQHIHTIEPGLYDYIMARRARGVGGLK